MFLPPYFSLLSNQLTHQPCETTFWTRVRFRKKKLASGLPKEGRDPENDDHFRIVQKGSLFRSHHQADPPESSVPITCLCSVKKGMGDNVG